MLMTMVTESDLVGCEGDHIWGKKEECVKRQREKYNLTRMKECVNYEVFIEIKK